MELTLLHSVIKHNLLELVELQHSIVILVDDLKEHDQVLVPDGNLVSFKHIVEFLYV